MTSVIGKNLLIACFVACPSLAFADGDWTLSIEADPVAFAGRGWSAAVGVAAPELPHWKLTGEIMQTTFPTLVDRLMGDPEWTTSLTGAFLAPQYYLAPRRRGLLFGVLLSVFRWKVEHGGMTTTMTELEPTPHVGYTIDIWRGVFITPFVGLAVPIRAAGSPNADGTSYSIPTVIPFAAVNLGYEF